MTTQVKLQPPGGVVRASTPGGAHSPIHEQSGLAAAVSLACLAVLAVGVVGWLLGSDAAKWTGLVLYALVGFGAAWLIALRRRAWMVLAFAAPIGLTFCILTGFILIESRIWSVGPPLFFAFVVATAGIHLYVVTRFALIRGLVPWIRLLGSKWRTFAPTARAGDWLAIGLSLLGMLLCFASAAQLNNLDPTSPSAFFGAVSPAWYVGALCIIASVTIGLAKPRTALAAALPVIALELVMNMSVSLAYSEPHSSWAARHVGVTLYMMQHGSVNTSLDIYQAWPGLFSGAGWVCKAIGHLDPMEIARWWPPVIGMATIVVFQPLARKALGDNRRAWIATAILIIGNTIGQDYYSPQATGYLLAIMFYALAYRREKEPRGISSAEWILLAAISVVVAVTHQLSPYMITGVMVVLVLFGHARSRLLPLLAVLPAAGWALVNLSVVRRYFQPNQIGHVFSNLLPPGYSRVAQIHKSHLIRIDSFAMAADALIIGVIAVVVLLHLRTKSRFVWALCALSGAGLFLANSYGNEGAYRVVLFALPWLGLLFADWRGIGKRQLRAVPLILMPVLYALFLFANLGIDYIRAVRPGDVAAIRTFERTAPAGSKIYVLGVSFAPITSSARYSLLRYRYYPYIDIGTNAGSNFNPKLSFDDFVRSRIERHTRTLRKHRIYVLGAAEPEAATEQYNLTTGSNYQALVQQFRSSPDWRLVVETRTAKLFELDSYISNIGRPAIEGQARVSQHLIALKGIWATLKPLTYSYQWMRCTAVTIRFKPGACVPIPGATSSTYQVAFSDQGSRLMVRVRVQDDRGVSAVATSSASKVVHTVRAQRPVVPRSAKRST